jgi:hypothetical protein
LIKSTEHGARTRSHPDRHAQQPPGLVFGLGIICPRLELIEEWLDLRRLVGSEGG